MTINEILKLIIQKQEKSFINTLIHDLSVLTSDLISNFKKIHTFFSFFVKKVLSCFKTIAFLVLLIE